MDNGSIKILESLTGNMVPNGQAFLIDLYLLMYKHSRDDWMNQIAQPYLSQWPMGVIPALKRYTMDVIRLANPKVLCPTGHVPMRRYYAIRRAALHGESTLSVQRDAFPWLIYKTFKATVEHAAQTSPDAITSSPAMIVLPLTHPSAFSFQQSIKRQSAKIR
ncbi:hypothetical protein BU23DRAFT_574723 [Bimuria novae-zelandiae CBS 107.79]|uniref:Uncharacterized protein n=1 Tax=Bimuria novae-zelandiae CBS 107.79 TaxID=1447943 RepID=A0A6A5UX13_9PLEO|nr:hypothetical protein BU23DRAFT_574723 [Bimuria novae-zelandiae CBS 107.79]